MKRTSVLFAGGEDVRYRIPLATILKQHYGIDVTFFGSEIGSEIVKAGFPYVQYPLVRSFNLFHDIKTLIFLIKKLKNLRIDIIQTFDTKPAVLFPLATMLSMRAVPLVRTITGMGRIFSENNLFSLPIKLIYMLFQFVTGFLSEMTVFQNVDDKKFFLKFHMTKVGKNAVIFGSGIHTEHISKIVDQIRIKIEPNSQLQVTMVSRLVKQKGVEEFLKAAKYIKNSKKFTKFVLVGPIDKDPAQYRLKELIAKYNVYVEYVGASKDIPGVLAKTDIFVLPSYYREGIPRVLLEAGAAKLPIITTNMPGCKEVVKDEWNGLLVPTKNSIALAEAINKLLSLPLKTLKLMGERSFEHVKECFDIEIVAKSYANTYRTIKLNN